MYQPPTDSLYKFCALLGIVIALFSLYYPRTIIIDLRTKYNAVDREIKATEATQDYLISQMDKMKGIISNTVAQQCGKYISDTNKLELVYSDTEVKDLLSRIQEGHRDVRIAIATLRFHHQEKADLLAESRKIHWLFILGNMIGTLLAIYGFRMWYKRIQVYEDRILAASSKKEN